MQGHSAHLIHELEKCLDRQALSKYQENFECFKAKVEVLGKIINIFVVLKVRTKISLSDKNSSGSIQKAAVRTYRPEKKNKERKEKSSSC